MGNHKAQGRSDQDPQGDKPAGNRPAQNARIATPGSVSEGLPRAGDAADFLGLNQELGAAPPPAMAVPSASPAPRLTPPPLAAPEPARLDSSPSVASRTGAPTAAHAAPNVAAEASASWLFQRQESETVVVPPAPEPEPAELVEPAPEIAYQEPEPPTRRMKPVLVAAGAAALLGMIGFATWSAFRASKSNSDAGGGPDVVAGTAVPQGPELVEPTATPSRYPGRRATHGSAATSGAESRAALVPTQPEPTSTWDEPVSTSPSTFDVASTEDAALDAPRVGSDDVATGEPAPTEWLDGASASGFDGSTGLSSGETDFESGPSHVDPTHPSNDPFGEPAVEEFGHEDGANEEGSFEDEVPEFDPNLRGDASAEAAILPAVGAQSLPVDPALAPASTPPVHPEVNAELDSNDASEFPASADSSLAKQEPTANEVHAAPVDEPVGSGREAESTVSNVGATTGDATVHDTALRASATGPSAPVEKSPVDTAPVETYPKSPTPTLPAGPSEAPSLERGERVGPEPAPSTTASSVSAQDAQPTADFASTPVESTKPAGPVPVVGAPVAPVDEPTERALEPTQEKSGEVAKPENTPSAKSAGSTPGTNSGSTAITDSPAAKKVDGAPTTLAQPAPVAQKSTDAGGLRVASSKDLSGVWTDSTIPFDAIGGAKRLLTPSVGRVRVHLVEKQVLEGLLYSVGEKQVTLSTDLGRIGIAADRVQKIERIEVAKVDPAKDPSAGDQRIKTPGGVIFGKIVSTEGGQTIVQTKEGSRVTFASKDVQILSGSKVGIKP